MSLENANSNGGGDRLYYSHNIIFNLETITLRIRVRQVDGRGTRIIIFFIVYFEYPLYPVHAASMCNIVLNVKS